MASRKTPSKADTQESIPVVENKPEVPSLSKKAAKRSSKPASIEAPPTEAEAVVASASDLVDEQLAKYRGMRDFAVTAEPSGAGADAVRQAAARTSPARAKSAGGLPFVIQKHAASHMHYDFRLGWKGVLKSWAVAKGPSYVVGDRRLAVQVEDHPMEYGGFEGVIPKGQYGGGTVMVWDEGTWWPQLGHENVDAGLREGSLKFEMHGTKMRGKWALIRMHTTKPAPGGRWKTSDKPQWLLIKEHDDFERAKEAPCITDEAPNSATTGRSLEEIASQEDHIWNSKETAGTGQAWSRQDSAVPSTAAPVAPQTNEKLAIAPRRPAKQVATELPAGLAQAIATLPKEAQPEFLEPELAQETEAPPEGTGWLHELKLDGYRMQARKSGRGVQMLTRSGLDWTHRVPSIAEAVAQLPVSSATLDGEVVVLAADGNTNFADLQASFQSGEKNPLTFFCFDLLHLEGRNPRNLSLRERKKLLAQILPTDEDSLVRLSEHLETGGGAMFQQACQLHAEGIVSKRAIAPYQAGRNGDWLKSKCLHEQEFVIGGFTLSSDGPDRVGSLLIGYNRDEKLVYAGRTGTGFTQKMRRDLRAQLAPLETKNPTFGNLPADARRGAIWVRPELVGQVRFATWTAEDYVRQAAFLGLREDKRPEEVIREEPTVAPQPKGSGKARGADRTSANQSEKQASTKVEIPAPSAPKTSPAKASAGAPPMRLTHPTKVLDPESGLTKRELAEFYWAVASRMLPHIADRPLSLVRCPDGAGKPCFYQKHVNHMLPPGVGSIDVPDKKTGVPEPYITLSTPEALAGLAQMGVLEVHPWGSHNGDLEHPDRVIFDLDPDEGLPWNTVAEAALEVRERLKRIGLESFLKTTGGKGLHIVAPILPTLDFAELKAAAHEFVLVMERRNPSLYLTKMTKAARKGKIYLDYLRNERGATAVAPFSPRARPGITVSVPLGWKELDTGERPYFSVREFASWQSRLDRDPWKRLLTLQQTLDPSRVRTA
ncbi:MAG: DNA ligase D [Janthinobacterium lividum]